MSIYIRLFVLCFISSLRDRFWISYKTKIANFGVLFSCQNWKYTYNLIMKFFFFRSDSQIANITKSEIVEKVNNWGYSELFLTGLFTHGDRDLLMGEYFSVFPSFNILYWWFLVLVEKSTYVRTSAIFLII